MKTIIKIKRHKHPYVMIDGRILEDEKLSWKAKGLLAYLLSKPKDWHINVSALIHKFTDGRDTVRNILKELRKSGYATLKSLRSDDNKTFIGRYWVVTEKPRRNQKDGKPERRESITSGFPSLKYTKKEAAAGAAADGGYLLAPQAITNKAELLVSEYYDMSVKEGLHLHPTGAPVKGATRRGWQGRTVWMWNRLARELLMSRGSIAMKVWRWWKNHRKDDFVPRAATFRQFCEKFDAISDAMSRVAQNNGERKSKMITVVRHDGKREVSTFSRERAQQLVERNWGYIVKRDEA